MEAGLRSPILNRIAIAIGFTSLLASIATAAVTSAYNDSSRAPTYKLRLAYSVLRAYCRSFTASQIQSIAPGSEETCRAFFLQQKIALHQSIFEDGTKGFWLGNPRAKTVMLFLHGGGYATPATASHLKLLSGVVSQAEQRGLSVGILFLIYDLAPAAQYPHQLGQALHAYRFLVEDQKRAPGTIILAGDSAGGNLALGLLACLTHPRSDIPGVASNEALKATILISPWVTFETTALSFTRNRYKDALDAAAITQWSKNYIGDKAIDGYVCPLMAPEGWWKGAKTGDICVIAGAEELFVDDIDRFVKVLKDDGLETTYRRMVGEPHDAMIMNDILHVAEPRSAILFQELVLAKL